MTPQQVQARDQAGYTKLTAVSVYCNGRKLVEFHRLKHNERGEAVLPVHLFDQMQDRLRARRGDTVAIGY